MSDYPHKGQVHKEWHSIPSAECACNERGWSSAFKHGEIVTWGRDCPAAMREEITALRAPATQRDRRCPTGNGDLEGRMTISSVPTEPAAWAAAILDHPSLSELR